MTAICSKAPEVMPRLAQRPYIFLAGGISGCADWQSDMAEMLTACLPTGTVFNPRRDRFDTSNSLASEEQIAWEFTRLWDADIVSFWFSRETLNPITLFEFGSQLARANLSGPEQRPVRLCVGIEPGYARAFDVRAQTKLYDPEIQIAGSIAELTAGVLQQVYEWRWRPNEQRNGHERRKVPAVRAAR